MLSSFPPKIVQFSHYFYVCGCWELGASVARDLKRVQFMIYEIFENN